ncbi:hypothetical protein ACEXQD_10455 [Herbiconiux sp. P15]|uniref:MmyB family transcriptional regulator n=1 Tax=Herbiconiux liukaitaii TaxID=3342799 RepID=UPI0035B88A82
MNADDAHTESRAAIRALISNWHGIPAVLCDRHFTVVGANDAARALSPAFTEGVNLARFTFVDADIDRDDAMYDTAANQVAAMLRESLDQHHGDDQFRGIVGDLSVMSSDFAVAWADDSLSAKAAGVIDFTATPVGLIRLGYQVLRVAGTEDDSLLVWGAADQAASDSLSRLLGGAETARGERL